MSFMEFNDSLRVGNRLIDQEHEQLIEFINLLQRALENDASEGLVGQVLNGVIEYTKTHFFVEEELMRAYDYPDVENHKKAHIGFKGQAQKLVEQYERGEGGLTESVMQFLKDWLTGHIMTVDAKLSAFLKGKTLD